jgi:hypothetical protein
MSRFAHALDAAVAPEQISLLTLAKQFSLAVEQTEAEGEDPARDPAVIVLGSFIAFHTHADVNTRGGYHELLGLCRHRFETSPELQ